MFGVHIFDGQSTGTPTSPPPSPRNEAEAKKEAEKKAKEAAAAAQTAGGTKGGRYAHRRTSNVGRKRAKQKNEMFEAVVPALLFFLVSIGACAAAAWGTTFTFRDFFKSRDELRDR
jgi:hypothetical protein